MSTSDVEGHRQYVVKIPSVSISRGKYKHEIRNKDDFNPDHRPKQAPKLMNPRMNPPPFRLLFLGNV